MSYRATLAGRVWVALRSGRAPQPGRQARSGARGRATRQGSRARRLLRRLGCAPQLAALRSSIAARRTHWPRPALRAWGGANSMRAALLAPSPCAANANAASACSPPTAARRAARAARSAGARGRRTPPRPAARIARARTARGHRPAGPLRGKLATKRELGGRAVFPSMGAASYRHRGPTVLLERLDLGGTGDVVVTCGEPRSSPTTETPAASPRAVELARPAAPAQRRMRAVARAGFP